MDIVLRISVVLVLFIPVSAEVNLPRDMSQAIYCECCSAVVQEIDKLLAKKSSDPRELQVVEAMEDICQAKYFSKYHYSPPTTIKACKFLIEKYEEDIEQLLTEKAGDSEQRICYKLTKACEGVDRTKKEKEDMDVRFNDQKQEVKNKPQKDDDGIQRMNIDINDPGAAARVAEQIKMQMGQQAMGGGSYGGDDDEDEEEEEEEEEEEGGDGPEDDTQASNKKTEL